MAFRERDREVERRDPSDRHVFQAPIGEAFRIAAEHADEEGAEFSAAAGSAPDQLRDIAGFKLAGASPGKHFGVFADRDIQSQPVMPAKNCGGGVTFVVRDGAGATRAGRGQFELRADYGLYAGVAGKVFDVVDDARADVIEEELSQGVCRPRYGDGRGKISAKSQSANCAGTSGVRMVCRHVRVQDSKWANRRPATGGRYPLSSRAIL